ncbi:MAG: addiction module toxin RelE [archaeon]
MPFSYDLSDGLREIIRKLKGRDPKKVEIIRKKIAQIVQSDEETIEHYKNLRSDLKEFKRVHIDKHFVLIFHYDKKEKFILFEDFDHHEHVYKR